MRLGVVLLLFSVTRLFFLFFNYSMFSGLTVSNMMKALLIGVRFDISVIIYFNLLIILMHILPVGKAYYSKVYQGTISFFYVVVNSLLLFINLGDSVFFHFSLMKVIFGGTIAFALALFGAKMGERVMRNRVGE